MSSQHRKKPQNLVPEASTGSGLNTKLTLSSFLENTEIKLKPRDVGGLRKGKRKKKRKPRSLRGVKQGKLAPQRSTLEIHTNEYQDQKPETGYGEITTETTHGTGYEISGDHEERLEGKRKTKASEDTKRKISAG